MVLYLPKVGNLNACYANVCSDVAGPSSGSSGDLFELSEPVLLLLPPLLAIPAAILYLSVTTSPVLPFGAFDVIMHKGY